MKRISGYGKSQYYIVPLLNRQFLVLLKFLSYDEIRALVNKRTIFFEYYDDKELIRMAFRGSFDVDCGDHSISFLALAISKVKNISFIEILKQISSIKEGLITYDAFYNFFKEGDEIDFLKENVDIDEIKDWFSNNKNFLNEQQLKLFKVCLGEL